MSLKKKASRSERPNGLNAVESVGGVRVGDRASGRGAGGGNEAQATIGPNRRSQIEGFLNQITPRLNAAPGEVDVAAARGCGGGGHSEVVRGIGRVVSRKVFLFV